MSVRQNKVYQQPYDIGLMGPILILGWIQIVAKKQQLKRLSNP
jgi:hypothetical protein